MKILATILALAGTPALAAGSTIKASSASSHSLALGAGFTTSGSGLSLATTRSGGTFVQGLIGIDYDHNFLVNADYLFASPLGSHLDWYGGPGITARNYGVGLRVPIGLLARFDKVPLQLGGELAPTLFAGRHHGWGFLDVDLYLRFVL